MTPQTTDAARSEPEVMLTPPIRLLIVDDESAFLQAVAQRLRMRGFDVLTAADGTEALEIARRWKFDLALLDLKMPGLNGRQVLELLKKEHRYLEVIILTGHGSLESAVECTKLGAFGYLPKPYELDRLLETLQAAYRVRLEKKFEADQERLKDVLAAAQGESPLAILRRLRGLDTEEK